MGIKIVGVVKNGHRIAYYECIDEQGRKGKLTKSQMIDEIDKGRCINAKVQLYYGTKIIRINKNDNVTTRQIDSIDGPRKDYSNYNAIANAMDRPSNIIVGAKAIEMLGNAAVGTPMKIKVGVGDFEQAIYAGIKEVQGREAFIFFNGKGIAGSFALSRAFIQNNVDQVQFKLNDNNIEEVAELTVMIRNNK